MKSILYILASVLIGLTFYLMYRIIEDSKTITLQPKLPDFSQILLGLVIALSPIALAAVYLVLANQIPNV